MQLHAKQFGNGINLMAGGHGADDSTGPTPILLQVVKREGENLVRSEPGPILVDDSEAIGIAVEPKAELRFSTADQL